MTASTRVVHFARPGMLKMPEHIYEIMAVYIIPHLFAFVAKTV